MTDIRQAQPTTYDRNSDLPDDVQAALNRRGQGAWRLLYNEAVKRGATVAEAMLAAWEAVSRKSGCKTCGSGMNFFN
ncbi:MAG: hypothetical protein WC977_04485 [Anaerovoracaceae bacterium]|jgi:cation transport regulator ChaB